MNVDYKIVIAISIILLAAIAVLVDNTVPLMTCRIPLSSTLEIRVSLHDSECGFLTMVFKNIKFVMDNWRSLKV